MRKIALATAALLLLLHSFPGGRALAQDDKKDSDPITDAKPLIDMIRENPDSIPLDTEDASRDLLILFRDPNDNPKREPGPINIQKTVGGLAYQGIPTFFRAPVALGPEDLKAGKVDIAIIAAPTADFFGNSDGSHGPSACGSPLMMASRNGTWERWKGSPAKRCGKAGRWSTRPGGMILPPW